MILLISYFAAISVEILFLLFFVVYVSTLLYSLIYGSFYVGTKKKEVNAILKETPLKKGSYVLELGSGMGVFLRSAAQQYDIEGKGIDVNPVLNRIANFFAKRKHLRVTFVKDNVLTTDFSKADVIYVFLWPTLIKKIEKRLAEESQENALIISHAFEIQPLKKYLVKTIEHKPFPTYFYQKK